MDHDYSGDLRPSIIATINNVKPTATERQESSDLNSTTSAQSSNHFRQTSSTDYFRRGVPYYESYIEDSFVGDLEREDEDDVDAHHDDDTPNRSIDDARNLHPSTIEFDFESFGPESFIYNPNVVKSDETKILESKSESTKSDIDSNSEIGREVKKTAIDFTDVPKQRVFDIDNLVEETCIDYRVIEPYKKVISHAGYCHHFDPTVPQSDSSLPAPAIIVFSACYLPDRSRNDYNYVMDHLFLYVLRSLHELIADDYILIYLHNTKPIPAQVSKYLSSSTDSSTTSGLANSIASSSESMSNESHLQNQPVNNLPTFTWMKRCYQMIDRKLRKNLRVLYIVRSTFWLKTIVVMCKPFISAKFSKKLRFVETMEELKKCLPVDQLILPPSIGDL